MWVALVVFLVVGSLVVRFVPPSAPGSSSAEQDFWRDASWGERRRLRALSAQLPLGPGAIGSLQLQSAVSDSRATPLAVDRVRLLTRGPRDVCLVSLRDGRTLRLTVFDDRNAQRFVAAWRSHEASAHASLRWIEGVGWQCQLHRADEIGTVASVYAWLADVDRSPVAV